MRQRDKELQLIYKLLEQTTSINVVSDFLKSKGLTYSASSWFDLTTKRLTPHLRDAKIDQGELVELLRSAEEYGRQHTLLYRATPAQAQTIMGRARIQDALKRRGQEPLLDAPKVFDQPEEPTVSDVRWQTARVDTHFTVKEIETRETLVLTATQKFADRMVRTYSRIRERCVNVALLQRNGDLEVRVASRTGMSGYGDDANAFMSRIRDLIPFDQFRERSLSKAKSYLSKTDGLSDIIRFTDIQFRTDDDITHKTMTGSLDADLKANPKAVEMLKLAAASGQCESSNFWFVAKDPFPTRNIHVLLSGEVNEFSINANCSEQDYKYVLDKIIEFNV